jgi:hypothetical protein
MFDLKNTKFCHVGHGTDDPKDNRISIGYSVDAELGMIYFAVSLRHISDKPNTKAGRKEAHNAILARMNSGEKTGFNFAMTRDEFMKNFGVQSISGQHMIEQMSDRLFGMIGEILKESVASSESVQQNYRLLRGSIKQTMEEQMTWVKLSDLNHRVVVDQILYLLLQHGAKRVRRAIGDFLRIGGFIVER